MRKITNFTMVVIVIGLTTTSAIVSAQEVRYVPHVLIWTAQTVGTDGVATKSQEFTSKENCDRAKTEMAKWKYPTSVLRNSVKIVSASNCFPK